VVINPCILKRPFQ